MNSVRKVWLAYLAGIVVFLLTAKLGIWQLHRAEEKGLRMAQWQVATQIPPLRWQADKLPGEYQQRIVNGQWLISAQILLDNRLHNGQVGYHVITPLLVSAPRQPPVIIAINRGWVAKPIAGRLPNIALPNTQTVIVRNMPLPRFFALQKDNPQSLVWQNLDWTHYQTKIGRALLPLYTVAVSDLGDGLIRKWPPPDLGRERNQAYALQWFALSLLTLGIMLFFSWRRYLSGQKSAVK